MSSMWRLLILPALLVPAASSFAQYPAAPAYGYSAPAVLGANVSYALNNWRQLRQSSGYSFASYAGFLIQNPDWPDEAKMRGWAEKAMRPGENAATVIAFFSQDKPKTGNGHARLAEAYGATGRQAEALAAARSAWASGDLAAADEQIIWQRFGSALTRDDHDQRADALLFARKPSDAARFLSMVTPQRQAAFAARVAMLSNAPDAEARYQSVIVQVARDAGLMMDRARYLRAQGYGQSARQLAARQHDFAYRPTDPERFYEMMLLLAQEASEQHEWQAAYNIGRQVDGIVPSGLAIADASLGIRDDYTSLAWLAGMTALDRLRNPAPAANMFERYARAGRSLQVQTKGDYWAGRAALAAGRFDAATAHFTRAASYPELFYGQLALERLGRSVPAPPAAVPQYTSAAQRAAFNNRGLVQAVRTLGQQGRSSEQALFIRALAESLTNDADRNLAVELGQQLGRQDLAVWTSRSARVKGQMFYVRQAYPSLPVTVSSDLWSVAHGITRQESSYDPYAVSHAGARGMMQLMTGTAREQAGKMGVGYDSYRLISDPSYNVMLGSAYFRRMLNTWDGSVPLAVASYNAGAGNVRKWIRNYGDPRGSVDMLKWIEAIPYSETKAYVQRVVENSVVYDSLRPGQQKRTAFHVSRLLGKSGPG